jgi:hypothetical protein
MQSFKENYRKYRWFFTSSNKLVIGGKSAQQNEELLKKIKNKNYVIMHTSTPGSPFAVIVSNKKPTKEDLEEAAIFTACFSQQWKQGKKKTHVDIFLSPQLYKLKLMKIGTWGVKPPIKRKAASLELVLTLQKGKLRAVPEKSVKKHLLKIRPGKTDKTKMAEKIQEVLDNKFSKEEILSALPSGGVSIVK